MPRRPLNRQPEQGDHRVWVIKNPPCEPECFPVGGPGHAKKLIEALADSHLLDPSVEANAFGLEIFQDGHWREWSERGKQIMDWKCSRSC